MITKPSIVHREAHPYAAVRLQVPIPFGKFLQPAYAKVQTWLAGKGLTHGPAIIRYLTTDMSTNLDIDVGFTIDQSILGDDTVITDVLPAGQYATLLYTGSYRSNGVYKANVTIMEWAQATGVAWKTSKIDGVEWWESRVEWYLTDPDLEKDLNKYQTELTIMVAEK